MTNLSAIATILAIAAVPALANGVQGSEGGVQQPKETTTADLLELAALAMSPRVTEVPYQPRYGLMARADTFSRPPNVCGYRADGFVLSCLDRTASCTLRESHGGCCDNAACDNVPTTCLDYTAVLSGDCDPDTMTDSQTACCIQQAPRCVIYDLVTDGTSLQIFGCTAGSRNGGTLLPVDPLFEKTATQSRTQSSSTLSESASATDGRSQETDSSGDDGNDEEDGGKKKNKAPIGAIVGGVVGGIAAIALGAIAIILFMRRKKSQPDNHNNNSAAPAMAQQNNPPGASPHSGMASPAYGYPSPGSSPQSYDPKMAAYQQQQQYSPQSFSPDQYNQQQYAAAQHQQQWGTPSPVQTSSPPPHGVAGELPATNPAGSPDNRAELG